jgi:PAS domain S-box-containing protein
VVVDEDANVLRWNSRAEEVFGWTAAEIENRHLGEFIVPEKNSGLKKGMEYFLMTGKDPILNRSVEIPALRKDGKEFPVEIVVSSARAEGKQIYIAFINDISERKRNERQLIDANLSLETSNKELEAFTYSVSHDLRAPLRAISGYSQLLVDRFKDKLDGQALAFINSIASNTKRMGRLIDDLLALSKFNRADIVRTEIDTNELVKAVIEEIGKSSDITKTTFRIHDLPRCHADYNLLVQVFINLISNAVKYSSLKDNPQVEIGAEEKDGETIFFIKDNGSGFDMKFYDKLFGVFQRLHDSAEFEGTGVGLAIVKRVISKHGGRVWAESVLNEGTVFYFTLNP